MYVKLKKTPKSDKKLYEAKGWDKIWQKVFRSYYKLENCRKKVKSWRTKNLNNLKGKKD
jgi:hypothetical protein